MCVLTSSSLPLFAVYYLSFLSSSSLLLLSILLLCVLSSFAFTVLSYFAFSFFSLFYICSLSFFDLQDTVTFLTRYLYPLPPSCTSSPPLIPHHLLLPSSLHRSASYLLLFFTLHFFSFCFLQLFPSFCVSSAHVDPSLAECSVGNRHLGRRISISPLACWDRFSKNTAKSYLTTYACGSAGVHKHTLSLFHFLLCVCVCVCVSRFTY